MLSIIVTDVVIGMKHPAFYQQERQAVLSPVGGRTLGIASLNWERQLAVFTVGHNGAETT